jgi:hypothetical protein
MDKGCAILFFTHWANKVTSALPYHSRRAYLLPCACMNAKKKFENQHVFDNRSFNRRNFPLLSCRICGTPAVV